MNLLTELYRYFSGIYFRICPADLFFRFSLPAEIQIPLSQNWVREGILRLADFAVILLVVISSIALDWAFIFRLFQGLVDAIAFHSCYSICKTFFQACFKAKHSYPGSQEHLSSLWAGIRLYICVVPKNSDFKMQSMKMRFLKVNLSVGKIAVWLQNCAFLKCTHCHI